MLLAGSAGIGASAWLHAWGFLHGCRAAPACACRAWLRLLSSEDGGLPATGQTAPASSSSRCAAAAPPMTGNLTCDPSFRYQRASRLVVRVRWVSWASLPFTLLSRFWCSSTCSRLLRQLCVWHILSNCGLKVQSGSQSRCCWLLSTKGRPWGADLGHSTSALNMGDEQLASTKSPLI